MEGRHFSSLFLSHSSVCHICFSQSTILISVLVTLFSSLGALLFDYLFIDVLSAPMIDSTKIIDNTNSHAVETSSSIMAPRMTRMTSSLKLNTEVRVVPSELVRAHSEAVSSFSQFLNDSDNQLREDVRSRNSVRMKRLTQLKPLSVSETRNVEPTTSIMDPGDDLLMLLLQELLEERKKLKREHERESFDSVWGYVTRFPVLTFLV